MMKNYKEYTKITFGSGLVGYTHPSDMFTLYFGGGQTVDIPCMISEEEYKKTKITQKIKIILGEEND